MEDIEIGLYKYYFSDFERMMLGVLKTVFELLVNRTTNVLKWDA